MAEPRNKVRGIGLPFEAQYSSCSNLKPDLFDWSIIDGEMTVHVDRGLLLQPDKTRSKEKTFGWICESKFIVPDVYSFLIHNHKILFNNFYNKIYTCDPELLNLNSNFKFCPNGSNYPWVKKADWKVYDKTKLCSMFCSPKQMTEGHIYRHQLARLALNKGFSVFGGAHGTPRTVIDPRNPWNTKIDGVRDYMFSIVVENGVYDNYTTEKLTDCFATGTIPVYWGTKKISDIFDSEGIIWLEVGNEANVFESLTMDLYISKAVAIKNNLQALNKLRIADDDLYRMITHETNNI